MAPAGSIDAARPSRRVIQRILIQIETIRVRIWRIGLVAGVVMVEITRRAFLMVAGGAGAALLTGCKVIENETPAPAGGASAASTVTAPAASLPQTPTEILITPTGSL